MQFQSRPSRFVAFATGATLAATALFPAVSAQASLKSRERKSDNYKYGAIGLGVLGAVLLAKGKVAPAAAAAAAAAGGYYAYKKGRDVEDNDRYGYNNRPNRGGNYGGANYGGGSNRGGYGTSYGGYNGGYGTSYGGYNGGYSTTGSRPPVYPDDASYGDYGRNDRRNPRGNYDVSAYRH